MKLSSSLVFGVAVSLPSLCFAGPSTRAVIEHLWSPSVSEHPLADEGGRIPILIPMEAVPPGEHVFEVAPGVGAMRLTPENAMSFFDRLPDDDMAARFISVGPPKRTQLEASGKLSGANSFRAETSLTGKDTIVGVVDTGIDIFHPTFRNEDGSTRIAWLLTWGAPRGVHADVERKMGCDDDSVSPCAVYSADEINGFLASGKSPNDVSDGAGHGTHCASIAAGNGGTTDPEDKAKGRFVGMAPEATLVIAGPSASGGFPDDLILRGTSFIFDRADAMGLPAVANLSLGGDFGPHDGSSLLEKGLSAMVGDEFPGRAIVVASGNSGGLYELGEVKPAGVHTVAYVDDHAPVRIPIVSPGAGAGNVYVWVHYREDDDISVGLDGPDGTWISPVSEGDDAGYDDDAGTTAGVVNNIVNGKSSLTTDTNGAVIAWRGKWEESGEFNIVVEGHGYVELWVTATGAAGILGTYFEQARAQGTTNTPATAPELLAVGCSVSKNVWKPLGGQLLGTEDDEVDSLCFFSAGGPTPTGLQKPEILAPGQYISAAMSRDADPRDHPGSMFDSPSCPDSGKCFVVAEEYAISAGTSMSAPHVTGAIALLYSANPKLTQSQITEVIQASARLPKGKIKRRSMMGPGELDLSQALAVLGAEDPSNLLPSAATSWWVLADEAVRPDPTSLLWATVELRRADGTVASGTGEDQLTVSVENGSVVRSPTKIRHGLYRFAVAAFDNTGGKTLSIGVRYGDTPIGSTAELLIANDIYLGNGDIQATGGCGLAPNRSSSGLAWFGLALSIAVGVRRARVRR